MLPAFCFQLPIRLVFLRARLAQKRPKLTVQIHAQFLFAIEAEFVFRRRRGRRRRGRRRREHGLVYRLEDEQVSRSDFSSSSSPSSSICFPHRRYRRFTHHTRVGHFLFCLAFQCGRNGEARRQVIELLLIASDGAFRERECGAKSNARWFLKVENGIVLGKY